MEVAIRGLGARERPLRIAEGVAEPRAQGIGSRESVRGARISWVIHGARITRIINGTRISRIINGTRISRIMHGLAGPHHGTSPGSPRAAL